MSNKIKAKIRKINYIIILVYISCYIIYYYTLYLIIYYLLHDTLNLKPFSD